MGKIVFKSKPAEHSRNSNNIHLLRDVGLEAVIFKDFKLKIKIVLFIKVFNFIYIELS